MPHAWVLSLSVAFLTVAGVDDAIAQMRQRGGSQQPLDVREGMGQIVVGLVPVYPTAHLCPPVASPFGSQTRYDGSARANDHGGFHNGIDISLTEGTPILAIAAGEVILSGTGGLLVGNYVWLRHTPADTGLPSYLYSRYQHLERLSPLPIGRRINAGDAIGVSGKTGTVGPYYGAAGYPHLHLTLIASDVPHYEVRGDNVLAPTRRFLDPLAAYMKMPVTLDNQVLRGLSPSDKRVPIPYQTIDGVRMPADTKVVWPVACGKR
jgi:murein DD-endopeptidase MepM/ murein hydrolase activator NlpD